MTSYDVSFYGAQALWSNNDPVWESVTDEVTRDTRVAGVPDVYPSPSVTTDQIICNMCMGLLKLIESENKSKLFYLIFVATQCDH